MKNDYVTLIMFFWNLKSYPPKIDFKSYLGRFCLNKLHIENFQFVFPNDNKHNWFRIEQNYVLLKISNFQKKTLQPTTVLKLDRLPNRITVSPAVLVSYPYEHIGLNKVV